MVTFILAVVSIFVIEGYLQHSWDYEDTTYILNDGAYRYDLHSPSKRYVMPGELVEISALSLYSDQLLACVQDEEGLLFLYDLRDEQVKQVHEFDKKGDFEGVEIINHVAYVLESDGDIFSFEITPDGIGEVSRTETDLSGACDAEGLGYDRLTEELLIACKNKAEITKKDRKGRAVYGFLPNEKEIVKKPRHHMVDKQYEKALEERNLSKKKHDPFKPSGIAVHPFTNNIYLIGSVGKMLVVLNRENEILNLIPLNPSIFYQPEGICFDTTGNLFIASEGDGEPGTILQFSLLSQE